MGDGGVACVPSQHIMERFPISENFCGGNNGKFDSKSVKVKQRKMKMKVKKEDFSKNKESRKGELSSDKVIRSSVEVGNGEWCTYKVPKEEIEEGEVGSWPRWDVVENGESNLDKPRKFEIKSEIEKGETPHENWRKAGELESGEIVPRKLRKDHILKGEFSSGRSRSDDVPDKFKKFDSEKAEFRQWRDSKSEIEKGEFIPDSRWHKAEVMKEKMHRDDSVKGKGWRGERDWTPPSGKYSAEKDFNRSGGHHFKRSSSRWETGADRIPRLGSKIVDEESSFRSEQSNGKNYGRDYGSGNRLKRHCNDSDGGDRKHAYGEYGEYTSSKSRRLSDDGSRYTHPDNYSHRSVERFNRNSNSTRNMPSDRYSGRQYESSLSNRVAYDKHGSSPRHSEWSPRDRPRDRTPVRRERSPYERSRNFDNRNSSPSYSERSPQDRSRYNDRKDRAPNFSEQSSADRNRLNNHRETNRKTGGSEKRSSHYGNRGSEEKLDQKDVHGRDTHGSAKESQERSTLHNGRGSVDEKVDHQSHVQEQPDNCEVRCKESPQADGIVDELLSMEEDMDISETPPHSPVVLDSAPGKWFYLDHFGIERGPSKLGDLKALVEEGLLVSDHLIKHEDSDRWIAVENAVSPLVNLNFPSIVSDTITQLVSPPDAPGNLLEDVGNTGQPADRLNAELSSNLLEGKSCKDENLDVSGPVEDLHIDERVGALLEGFDVVSGQELETLGEALQIKFEQGDWHPLGAEGLGCRWSEEQPDQKAGDKSCSYPEPATTEAVDWSVAPVDGESTLACFDSNDCYFGRWSCKGGDWIRYEEASQDRSSKKKFVLNDGYPLCLMSKSGFEDPRRHHKDDLYYPSQHRKLDLPAWAFTVPDDSIDCNGVGKLGQPKPVVARGVKGALLPVVRINSCVVNDPGSSVSESRTKARGKDRYSARSGRPQSGASDMRRSSEDGTPRSRSVREQDSFGSPKSISSITIPKDRLCSTHELQLHIGDWYYLDGAGHEQGPFSFTELQIQADQGIIRESSSIFRKSDRIWVPITSAAKVSEGKIGREICGVSKDSSRATVTEPSTVALGGNTSFNRLHPQFVGFTRGKLHELVMKSYKSREFAAAINEVLDPWINTKQPKKEMEKYIHNLPLHNKFQHSAKRPRLLADESDEGHEMDDEIPALQEEYTFEHLCRGTTYHNEEKTDTGTEAGKWGLLDGHVLARVFYFLRTDVKSLLFAGSTCKHWRSVSKFYKDISKQVDLSSIGPSCTDNALQEVMNGYRKEKVTSLVLLGCTNISSAMLEEIVGSFPSLSCVDVRGCTQLADLADKYPNINWIRSRGSLSKPRGMKHINERSSGVKNHNGLDSHMEESNGLRDYFESLDRRDSANQAFRKSLYKRSKLFDARKSSSITSRDAHLRRWAFRKSENSYKRMEQFLASSLKDIMKENSCDFFVSKVAEIEDRMKDGYYTRRGMSSVKEDIRRMCRDAIRVKNRGDTADVNHIVTLFIRLAKRLEDGSKLSHERDGMIKNWKDDSSLGSGTSVKYKKKLNKTVEKKTMRSNGSSYLNAASDYGDYASDREIKRRLLRLNKRSMDSGSETSDGLEGSSEETKTDSESSASGSETDSDFRSRSGMGESRGEGYFMTDDGFDSLTHDREWGARMTKASLVPPVTRKYEEIDHYVVVADEEEVKRKMRVSLPDDFVEKLRAQENGTEETDMEIPEVKDYKPRKQLGIEVIEQEVYGIDPYTHNLLLDSMPEGLGWNLRERHVFIEDVLLRRLNKQARHFTGTGSTPMKYSLQPVVEDILKNSDDMQTLRYCESIMKAINSRPEDNYVAYRKGLGVVCDKEGGFDKDDFVVEFLGEVYPAWKWFEKQDGIRSLQKNSKDPVPEFYNIYLERPKGDADGYDLVVVDAMHKANYASRICHSCRPNCEAKVTAVDGQYQIGIYAVRPIEFGEEITFDYNSVTESKEEYDSSVCLCGSQVCRGSYLNLTGEGAFQKVLKEWHGILDRHHLLLEACEVNFVSEEDYIDLGRAGLGSCLLGGLPDWLIAYSARLVRFINFERTKLPEEILRHNMEEKKKYYADADISIDVEKSDAEVQAEGVYNQRLQNLALTLDKVRYVMRCVFGDPKKAPPPLERLSPEEIVSVLWKGEGSLVHDLIECMAPHIDNGLLKDLMSKVCAHDPSTSIDIQKELRKSLIWLRDEVRGIQCTYKSRHDAAADLIHVYAHTKCFFRVKEYKSVTSPAVYISPLDLGPKYADKMGSGLQEYCKTYGENYCLGQLIYWHNQTYTEPDSVLARSCRGCLSLPDMGSFYTKIQKPSRHRVYGPRTAKFMLSRMEKQPQRAWPNDRIWSFKDSPKIIGSPMLDAVLFKSQLDKDMVNWLKLRPAVFQAKWDI